MKWKWKCIRKLVSPFSPLIDISSPSSRLHITYGSGKPLALHVNVTFVPSLTTISLLVIDSTITGGTRNSNETTLFKCWRGRLRHEIWYFTYNLQVALSRSHGIRVHLTHVPSSIGFFDFSYVQIPAAMVIVSQNDSRILCYNVVMDTEDGLGIYSHPCYLQSCRRANTSN